MQAKVGSVQGPPGHAGDLVDASFFPGAPEVALASPAAWTRWSPSPVSSKWPPRYDVDRGCRANPFAINTVAVFLAMQSMVRLVPHGGGGAILLATSITGIMVARGLVGPSGSKAALVGMTRAATKSLGPQNLRVDAVAPWRRDGGWLDAMTDGVRAERRRSIPLGRPEEVVAFLAGDRASCVTERVIGVEGALVV